MCFDLEFWSFRIVANVSSGFVLETRREERCSKNGDKNRKEMISTPRATPKSLLFFFFFLFSFVHQRNRTDCWPKQWPVAGEKQFNMRRPAGILPKPDGGGLHYWEDYEKKVSSIGSTRIHCQSWRSWREVCEGSTMAACCGFVVSSDPRGDETRIN